MDLILAKLRRTGATAGGVGTEAANRIFLEIDREGDATLVRIRSGLGLDRFQAQPKWEIPVKSLVNLEWNAVARK